MPLRSSTAMVAKAAAGFGVSTILKMVAEKTFSGAILDEINAAAPDMPVFVLHLYDRAWMNRAALRLLVSGRV